MSEDLKSLKNPTRILTILMFLAVFVSSVGADGLAQLIPGASPVLLAGIVGVAAYAVAQYGTEKRIVRAEELKDQEYESEALDIPQDEFDTIDEEMIDDGAWGK